MTQTVPIFYLNRGPRPDRDLFMREQFAALGLSAIRIEGVEGSRLPADHKAWGPRHPFISRNNLACSLTHMKAWEAMLTQGAPAAVVFEDDALLSPRLTEFLAALHEPDIDILRLEAVSRTARILPATKDVVPGIQIRRYRSMLHGSAGYVIAARAARLLLHMEKALLTRAIDASASDQRDGVGRFLNVALIDPGLCIQLDKVAGAAVGRSDIVQAKASSHWNPSLWRQVRNAADHLWYLPRGLTRTRIRFEAPDPVALAARYAATT